MIGMIAKPEMIMIRSDKSLEDIGVTWYITTLFCMYISFHESYSDSTSLT